MATAAPGKQKQKTVRAADLASERDLLATVLKMAELYGWRAYHVFEQRQYARRTSRGFPDLILVRLGRLIFAELKSERGQLTPDQKAWLEELEMVQDRSHEAVQAYMWRPSDLDEIEGVLK